MHFLIDKEFENTRLDRFIKRKTSGQNENSIFKLIGKGKIRVNHKKEKHNYRLQIGDSVHISDEISNLELKCIIDLNSEEIAMISNSVIFEDKNILIFNKAPNVVMYKGTKHYYGITEMIRSYTNNPDFSFVNRIDRATSGLVIGAKNLDTIRELSKNIKNRNIEKRYYILVDGVINEDSFRIKSYLKKTDEKVIELDSEKDGAKESISYFSVIKRGKSKTLLEATLYTGRTHQLRVQLSNKGNPIIGDQKYSKTNQKLMYLFSHQIVIPQFNVNINLDIPSAFSNNLFSEF